MIAGYSQKNHGDGQKARILFPEKNHKTEKYVGEIVHGEKGSWLSEVHSENPGAQKGNKWEKCNAEFSGNCVAKKEDAGAHGEELKDPENIEIDFIESRVSDHSGIEALENLIEKYLKKEKNIRLTHLSPECKTLLLKANPKFEKVIEASIDDPRYYVVTDLVDREV